MTLIDLDAVGDPAPESDHATRRTSVWLAGLIGLALGGLLGGMATYRWQAQRTQAAEATSVSVVVLADAGGWPGDGATPATAINGKVTAVHLFGHVSIVNARRAAIKVGGLTARGMTQLTGQVVEVSQTFADHGF